MNLASQPLNLPTKPLPRWVWKVERPSQPFSTFLNLQKMTLTPHQQGAFDSLMNFASLDSTAGMAVLSGYAGTGKTFLVGKLISELKTGRSASSPLPPRHTGAVRARGEDRHPVDFLTGTSCWATR